MPEYINALCLAFPNGQALWIEADREYMEKVIQRWKDDNPEYDGMDCTMGAVQIRMFKHDFKNINACDPEDFDFPEKE